MMLSFLRKRLPSKDRNNEHLQQVKSIQNQDDQIKRTKSTNELDIQNNENKKMKKNKKKQRSSLNIDQIVNDSNISTINKSYSDVDYFPMMPGALSQSINHDKTSTNDNSLSDCYFNPSESVQTINYIQTTETKPRVFQIPVIDCRKEQQIPNYKDVDHQRTKALREVTEQRTQQRSVK